MTPAPTTPASVAEVPHAGGVLGAILIEQSVWADGHAIKTCGPTTGHFVRAIAYCENPETAEFFAACSRAVDYAALRSAAEAARAREVG